MKPGSTEKMHKRCLVILFTLWTAAFLCYLADAKGLATGLVVVGVVLELIALLIMWFVSEDQKRDRE
jgi:hypothetical protein